MNYSILKNIYYAFAFSTLVVSNGCSTKADGAETSFKVYGNCEMCEKTIEGSLKNNNAIKSVDWNTDSKMITISYDSTKITEKELHQKIASSGYDTDLEKGNDQAYSNLHECCKYDRRK